MLFRACLLLALSVCVLGHAPSDTYPNSVQLNSDFMLYWKVSGSQITFELHAEMAAGGWAGIGFSKNGTAMYPADIAMGFVDPSHTGHCLDAVTSKHGMPDLDKQQDYTLVKAAYDGGHGANQNGELVVAFSRELNTHDGDDVVIHSGPMNIIWAYGTINSDTTLPTYHQTHRGGKQVTLIPAGAPVGK